MTRYGAGESGEFGRSPFEIPWKGWKAVLWRTYADIGEDNVSLVAAGIAFYGIMALFPALAALVILYGLVANQDDLIQQMSPFRDIIPAAAYDMIVERLKQVITTAPGTLGLSLIVSLSLAIWGATRGVKALIIALNIAYEETDRRGFFHLNIVAIVFTVSALIFLIVSLALVAIVPAAAQLVPEGGWIRTAVLWLRWPVLALLAVFGMSLLYRYGPCRSSAQFSWVLPGAIGASLLWLAASAAFSFYVSNFGNYDATFGSAAAVVVLLMWLYVTAFAFCLGGELNAELELQTRADSTTGVPRPRGARGAYVADNVITTD